MTENRSNPEDRPSFSSSPDPESGPGHEPGRSGEFGSAPDASPSMGDRSAFALDMARIWMKEHQKATMLGAFAVGVFAGALLRD
jgi:hypothetical protein